MNKQFNAQSLAKYSIFYGYRHNLFLNELIKKWDDSTDLATRCAQMQVEMNNQYMAVLVIILKMFSVKCKHPKKYHDKTKDGQWYCMNCNSDLSSKLTRANN